MRFGVIGEDATDCNTVGILIQRIALADHSQRVGVTGKACRGCAHLERKAGPHLNALAVDCAAAVIVRDLDHDVNTNMLHDEPKLHEKLSTIPVPAGLKRLVCIPVEEIEAWFWADEELVKRVTRGRRKAELHPDQIRSPKEKLIAGSIESGSRPRYNPSQNPELARLLNLDVCTTRCRAFSQLRTFVGQVLAG